MSIKPQTVLLNCSWRICGKRGPYMLRHGAGRKEWTGGALYSQSHNSSGRYWPLVSQWWTRASWPASYSTCWFRWQSTTQAGKLQNKPQVVCNCYARFCTLNESLTCCLCRDSDGAIIRPLPKVKRILSDPMCLPHLVQVYYTIN